MRTPCSSFLLLLTALCLAGCSSNSPAPVQQAEIEQTGAPTAIVPAAQSTATPAKSPAVALVTPRPADTPQTSPENTAVASADPAENGEIVKLALKDAPRADESRLRGKTLEVTGVVGQFSQTGNIPMIFLRTGEASTVPLMLDKAEAEPWAKVGVGQTVTLRGRFGGRQGSGSLFWRIEPTLAPPIYTAQALAEMVTQTPHLACGDLTDQPVIVVGTVKLVEFSDLGAAGLIIEGSNDCDIYCTAFPELRSKLEKYRPGSKIQVAGLCRVETRLTVKQISMPLVSVITVPLPVPGVEYAQEVASLASRLKQQADAMRSSKAQLSASAADLPGYLEKDANAEKYAGKVVELTGKIRRLSESPDGHDVVILATSDHDVGADLACELCVRGPWDTMAPGQTVVVRGKAIKGRSNLELKEGVVLKVEEADKPLEVTADNLAAELEKDRAAFESRYVGKWVVFSGAWQSTNSDSTILSSGEGCQFVCSFAGAESGRHRAQFLTLRPGDTVRILGKVTSADSGGKRVQLEECWERQ